MPGVCEEVLCRGVLLHGLRSRYTVPVAVLVSSLVFAALHGSPYRFLPQACLGALLALLTLRCGSIWPAVLLHAAHNGIAVVLAVSMGERLESAEKPDAGIMIGGVLTLIAVYALTRMGWRLSERTSS